MIQNLIDFENSDRGVSPVIGVILMVAITVILAAVIGTFVLGLGDSLQQAPQSQLEVTSDSANNVTLSHTGGDELKPGNIEVTIGDNTTALSNVTNDNFGVGQSVKFTGQTNGDNIEVVVVHTPSESIILDAEVDIASP